MLVYKTNQIMQEYNNPADSYETIMVSLWVKISQCCKTKFYNLYGCALPGCINKEWPLTCTMSIKLIPTSCMSVMMLNYVCDIGLWTWCNIDMTAKNDAELVLITVYWTATRSLPFWPCHFDSNQLVWVITHKDYRLL